jgi:hypothetical protein
MCNARRLQGLHNGPCNGENTTIQVGAGPTAVYQTELAKIVNKLRVYRHVKCIDNRLSTSMHSLRTGNVTL